MKAVVIIVFVAFVVWYLWPRPDVWTGYLYPNKYDLTQHVETGAYESLENCRAATLAEAWRRGFTANQIDYECGLNCKLSDTGSGLSICEETKR